MSDVGWIAVLFAGMFALIAIGLPIAFSVGIMGAAVVVIVSGSGTGLIIIPSIVVDMLDRWLWLAVPLFLMVGSLMGVSGVSKRLIAFANSLIRHVPGGLSHVSVLVNIMMAGISGSLLADAAAIGKIMIQPMKEKGFPAGYCAAVVACGGLIGPLIPPSVNFILVGMLSNTSILRLWLGGVIPGLLLGALLIATGYLVARAKGYGKERRAPLREMYETFIRAGPALVIPLFVMAGLRTGMVTPTEAGAAVIAYILPLGALVYRNMTWRAFIDVCLSTVKITGSIGIIAAASAIFGLALSMVGAGPMITKAVIGISTNPLVFLCLMAISMLFIGCVLDIMPVILIFLPLFLPAVHAFGVNMVHFGVIFGYTSLVGQLTPPVGVCMYLTCGIAETNAQEFVKHGWPFLVVSIGLIFLLIFFPPLITWLPNLVMGVVTKL